MKLSAKSVTLCSPNTLIKKDDRFYEINGVHYVRCTQVLDAGFPKDEFFYKWVAANGWNAEKIKSEAGDRGSRIHNAIFNLLSGSELSMLDFNDDEWNLITIFYLWYQEYQPEILFKETTVLHKKLRVAGTFDAVAKINGAITLIDWKTSKTFSDKFWYQTSFYKEAFESMGMGEIAQTAVLRLGTKHKKGYEYVIHSAPEIKKDFETFKLCKKMFDVIVGDIKPNSKEVMRSIKL